MVFQSIPEEVWEYLTKPELIEQWLMKNNFKPALGYKFQFTFAAKEGSKYAGVVNCEITDIKPCSKLSYTWDGSTTDGRVFNSEVEWRLRPKDNGTELQLSHDGFTVLEDILNHSGGWDSCLKKIETLLNQEKNNSTNTRRISGYCRPKPQANANDALKRQHDHKFIGGKF